MGMRRVARLGRMRFRNRPGGECRLGKSQASGNYYSVFYLADVEVDIMSLEFRV